MQKYSVQVALEKIADARREWNKGRREFDTQTDQMMTLLIQEAARNFMSVAEVAEASGLTRGQVRVKMRALGLDPKQGKRLLADKAAKHLAENAELLAVDPHQLLASPLAYLPMGRALVQELMDQRIARVTELDEPVSGNDERDDKALGWERAHTMLCGNAGCLEHRNPWMRVRA